MGILQERKFMIANYHTHTSRCHHAVGQDEEYVQSAITAGLQILGFSDHTPYFFSNNYCSKVRMLPQELQGYTASIRQLQDAYKEQIEIRLGVEAEFYPDLFQDTLSLLQDNGIEYMLLGQHWIGNEYGEIPIVRPTDDKDRLVQYCRQVCQAMETGKFSYLAHPDVIDFIGSSKIYEENMRCICRTAKACQIPLELNLLGIRCKRHYPKADFWRLAGEEDCPVILGIDAHDPKDILDFAAETAALDMAKHYGLNLLSTITLRKI